MHKTAAIATAVVSLIGASPPVLAEGSALRNDVPIAAPPPMIVAASRADGTGARRSAPSPTRAATTGHGRARPTSPPHGMHATTVPHVEAAVARDRAGGLRGVGGGRHHVDRVAVRDRVSVSGPVSTYASEPSLVLTRGEPPLAPPPRPR